MGNRYGNDNLGWQNDSAYRQAMGQQVGWQRQMPYPEPPRRHVGIWPVMMIVIIVALVIGDFVLQYVVPSVEQSSQGHNRTVQVEATVTDIKYDWDIDLHGDEEHDYPVVTFTDSDGTEHTEVCTHDPMDSLFGRRYEKGDWVTIKYDPTRPYDIKIV